MPRLEFITNTVKDCLFQSRSSPAEMLKHVGLSWLFSSFPKPPFLQMTGEGLYLQCSPKSPRALMGTDADSWAPSPGTPRTTLEKQHSRQTLSESPSETEFFLPPLPPQGAGDADRHPQRRHSRFKSGREAGAPISQRVLCEITTAHSAVEPQQRLIKKRSVGPLELIINYFCPCHTRPCLGKFAGTSATLKGFGV